MAILSSGSRDRGLPETSHSLPSPPVSDKGLNDAQNPQALQEQQLQQLRLAFGLSTNNGPTPMPASAQALVQAPAPLPNEQHSMSYNSDGSFDAQICLDKIDSFANQAGGFDRMSGFVRGRVFMLQQACQKGMQDTLCLMIHQFLCLFHVAPHYLPKEIRGIDSLYQSINVLESFLAKRCILDEPFLSFFATFPVPFAQLLDQPRYQGGLRLTLNFLKSLTTNYTTLEARCRERSYPPLAEELIVYLKLFSPVIQRVLHSQILRTIFAGAKEGFIRRGISLFLVNQQILQWNVEQTFTQQQLDDLHRQYAPMYGGLYDQAFKLKTNSVAATQNSKRPAHSPQSRESAASTPVQTPASTGQQEATRRGSVIQANRNSNALSTLPTLAPRQAAATTAPPTVFPGFANYQNLPPPTPIHHPQAHTQNFAPQHHQNVVNLQSSQVTPVDPGILQHGHPHVVFHSQLHPGDPMQPRPPMSIAQRRQSGREFSTMQHPQTPTSAPRQASSGSIPVPILARPLPQSQPLPSTQGPHPLFFPRKGTCVMQTVPPAPDTYAVHISHLRSPQIIVPEHSFPQNKYYRYVSDFVLLPRELPTLLPLIIHDIKFSIPLSETIAPLEVHEFEPSVRVLTTESTTYRLRCVKNLPPSSSMSTWIPKDNEWPVDVYFRCNDHPLQQRRKLHFGKDLPIDITPFVNLGPNIIHIVSNRHRQAPPLNHHIGIETIKLTTHSAILSSIRSLPAEDIKDSITSALSPSSGSDSDSIHIQIPHLTIALTDPILSTSIWDDPVRGAACQHREAFDLTTFLATRAPPSASEPCTPDAWRCPICGGDARPNTLVRDQWLVGVRAALAERGLLETRFIEVDATANWVPCTRILRGNSSASLGALTGTTQFAVESPGAAEYGPRSQSTRSTPQVVMLDDNDDDDGNRLL